MPERIYLASPYMHPDLWVREARFNVVTSATAQLVRQGFIVFSPVSMGHSICNASGLPMMFSYWRESWLSYLEHWATHLLVLRLPDWEFSEGVTTEILFAQRQGIPVQYIDLEQIMNETTGLMNMN